MIQLNSLFRYSLSCNIVVLLLAGAAMADSGAYRSLTVNSPKIPVESPFAIDLTAGSNVTTFISCFVYVDNIKYSQVSGGTIKANVTASLGEHKITVQCYDRSDNWTKQTFYVQVVSLQSGAGHSVGLKWNASTAAVGYNLYRSANGSIFSRLNSSRIGVPAFTDSAVYGGTTYYYYVTAVSSQGRESAPSNTAKAVIP